MKLQIAIRLTLTFLLLSVIWHHSHWSVALAITGLSINNEILTYTKQTRIRRKPDNDNITRQ